MHLAYIYIFDGKSFNKLKLGNEYKGYFPFTRFPPFAALIITICLSKAVHLLINSKSQMFN